MVNLIRSSLVVAALSLGAARSVAGQAAPARTPPPRMLHPAAGKAECLSCHGPGANEHIRSTPATHRFPNTACAMCHRPVENPPPPSQHVFDAEHAACLTCHVAGSATGAKAPPASHATFDISICQMCHQPAAAPGPGH